MVSVMCDETGPVGRIPPGNAFSLVEWDAVLWDGNGFFQDILENNIHMLNIKVDLKSQITMFKNFVTKL
jgi:hypothetical protein